MRSDVITVMLVDDHPVVRDGYRRLLESYPEISVVAEANNGENACLNYPIVNPDVVVLDLNMPGIGGIETIRRLCAKDSRAKILVFTMHESKVMIKRALEAGASGYLVKSSTTEQMVEAIQQVATGKTFLSHILTSDIDLTPLNDGDDPLVNLTKREFQIFRTLAEGQSVSKIAHILSISPKTVGVHQTRLMHKLNLKNAAELTRLAIRCGIIDA